jgi:hypothetical protein
MAFSRTLTGNGVLVVSGAERGPVSYEIDVRNGAHGSKIADGRIEAGAEVLHAAFESGEAKLIRDEGGQDYDLIVTGHNTGQSWATVAIKVFLPGM